MAKQIFTAHFNHLEKVFDQITDGVENFIKRDENINKKAGALLARDLVQTINENYTNYANDISSYVHGESNIKTSITDTKKGCIVHVTGKDILYEEYGTGTRGARSPHPRHDRDGMKPYGSGQNVIHRGEKNNGLDTPYWYTLYRDFPGYLPNDFNGENIRATDYVWRHNKIITKGLPAGMFIYNSCRKYQSRGGFDKQSILKQTITQSIKKDFVEKINKQVKVHKVTEKPEVRVKMPSNETFKRNLLAQLLSQKEGL